MSGFEFDGTGVVVKVILHCLSPGTTFVIDGTSGKPYVVNVTLNGTLVPAEFVAVISYV
jgi:hypothetical protein